MTDGSAVCWKPLINISIVLTHRSDLARDVTQQRRYQKVVRHGLYTAKSCQSDQSVTVRQVSRHEVPVRCYPAIRRAAIR